MGKSRNNDTPQAYQPSLPTVNLLPEDIREITKVESVYRWLGVIAVIALVALGGAFVWKQGDVTSANNTLAEANNEQTALKVSQENLADVDTYYAQVTANQTAIQQSMSKEVLFSDLSIRLRSAAPAGLDVDTVAMSADTNASTDGTSTSTTSCPSPDPFTPSSAVGCITLSGKADNRDAIGGMLDNLNRDDHFTGAFVSSTTTDQQTGAISFTATVGLTDKVFSGRYQDDAFLKGEQK